MLYDIYGNKIEYTNNSKNEDLLDGKKWLPIGDSITTGGGYRGTMLNFYGLSEIGGGYADGRQVSYSSGANSCALEHLNDIADGIPDVITIALGTNDYGNSCPLGSIEDSPDEQTVDSFTFYGCYRKLVEYLSVKYPEIPIVLLTPFQRVGGASKNSDGHTLADYAEAIKSIGNFYSLPVCDIYAQSGLSIGTISDVTKAYTSDGLHPVAYAARVIAPKIADTMSLALDRADIKCTYLNMSNGGSYTLTSTNPQRIYVVSDGNQRIHWQSTNENVVKVAAERLYIYANITAVSNGIAEVEARCGDVVAHFNITVALT